MILVWYYSPTATARAVGGEKINALSHVSVQTPRSVLAP
jgi:hypothetical protein